MKRRLPTFECPHCGAPVKRGAAVCRECGSDAATGWSEDAESGGVDIPAGYGSDEFDYDAFLAEEGLDGRRGAGRRALRGQFVRAVIFVLIALMLWWLVAS